ncbi:MAG TPA: VOC family protein [Pilimelia sp.]|nr:VOC family protein [Pilimelia sp.]
MSGRVVHFEIPADDVERARTFYREAFGWEMTPMPEMNYTMVATTAMDESGLPIEPGAINGGMSERRPPITSTVITVDVQDIDATLPMLEKLGGAVVQGKTAVGEMGYVAYFTDSEGNVVGLWQSATR